MRRPTLDEYMMALAYTAARRTTCLRKGVGCALADDRGRLLALAYNGVAAGMPHCNEATLILNPALATGTDAEGALIYRKPEHWERECIEHHPHACQGAELPFGVPTGCEAVHAEQNAIVQCSNTDLIATAYVTTAPCKPCMKLLMNTGCRRIVFRDEHTDVAEVQAMWEKTGRRWERLVSKEWE